VKKVIFQHLAKTAGTSLIRAAKRAFRGSVCPARYDGELTTELIRDDRFLFYQGHFSFEMVERFKDANPDSFAFVFLRHPINRVISQYYNWVDPQRTKVEYAEIMKRQMLAAEEVAQRLEKFKQSIFGLSLEEFVNSTDPDIVDVVYNHQTRYVSRRAAFGLSPLHGYLDAIDNLLNFYDFVGTMETYDASAAELFTRLHLDPKLIKARVRANTNDVHKANGRYRVHRATALRLAEMNVYDLCIFHHVLGKQLLTHGVGATASELLRLPELL